jgi:hypothetical protein
MNADRAVDILLVDASSSTNPSFGIDHNHSGKSRCRSSRPLAAVEEAVGRPCWLSVNDGCFRRTDRLKPVPSSGGLEPCVAPSRSEQRAPNVARSLSAGTSSEAAAHSSAPPATNEASRLASVLRSMSSAR